MKEQYNYITGYEVNQYDSENLTDEILSDESCSGRERPWKVKKEYNMKLADIYQYVDCDKSDRLKTCGDVLEFAVTPDGKKKLYRANFCRVRLCPMCQWRRSLKVYSQMTKVFAALGDKYAIVCLNLTVRNCSKSELSQELNHMTEAFNRLTKYKDFNKAVKGYYKATEITHNIEADTMHPHFHTLLVVNKSYFTDDAYISKDKWISLWKKALKVDYDPTVYVRKLYLKDGQDITKALCEVTKYTVKEADYITDDIEMDVSTVSVLDKALDKRHFITLGGILKEIHKKLNLTETEDDSDLVHVDEENQDITEERKDLIRFVWHSGYKQYYKAK